MSEPSVDRAEQTWSWPAFMRRHAMVWDRAPTSWRDAPFLGNGMLGAMLHLDDAGVLCVEVGRSDVSERRPDGDVYDGQHRLRIGRFRLRTNRPLHSFAARLDLWNAELVGRFTTGAGAVRVRLYVHAVEMAIALEWSCTGGEAIALEWQPELAISPHVVHRNKPIDPAKLNPPPRFGIWGNGTNVCTQDLKVGGGFATAWRVGRGPPGRSRCLITVANGEGHGDAEREAVHTIATVNAAPTASFRASHRAWWHDYYPASRLSIPDRRLESFYWIQMNKLGSATRAERQVLDLMGPWPAITVWPGIWWNLNIQLCYYPVYAANRIELGESLCRFLDRNVPNFIANVPEAWRDDSAGIDVQTGYGCRQTVEREFCNLAWTCHNYWLQYRYSMDESLLDRLYPLLSRSMNLYWHLLREEADGRLHVPRSRSPEYGTWAEDTTINLALIRWGCRTLMWICEHQRRDEPLVARWRDMLDRLTPYPIDDTGLMIGRDVPLKESHRHYSHLLMIYPLYLMTWEQPEHRALIERSLKRWIGFEGGLQGYTFSGAASIYASIGQGDAARDLLNQCLDRYIQPNTMYCEWDSPVMETPLSVATSVQEMLLQSWCGVIRIFPALPNDWADVSFDRLRAEGAFLVSAVRRAGRTRFVRVHSLAGEPCVIDAPFDGPIRLDGPATPPMRQLSPTRFEVQLAAGDTATICLAEEAGPFEMLDVNTAARDRAGTAPYGLNGDRSSWSR